MIIETTSRESMELDLARYFDITTDELYQYIDGAAEKASCDSIFYSHVFENEIASIISRLQPMEPIDSIMCFHLSRRLNNSLDDLRSYNLKDMLLGDNPLVQFLKAHSIRFKEVDSRIAIYFQGHEELLDESMDKDICYLRARLGYNFDRRDYCFNGFAMRDLLMKNSYTINLSNGPEFLQGLSKYLRNKALITDFVKQSTYFCYTLKIPLEDIIFDARDKLDTKGKEFYLVSQICYRLLKYRKNDIMLGDEDNPIIRVANDSILPADYVVHSEVITPGMMNRNTN